ncbi:MAG TPA: helix-turn-helix domain-containing protein, partial [Thermoguttaceae bacterium]|nr:helix-turn-helix domain-containing protein [Thermoguttaceae bacterium]
MSKSVRKMSGPQRREAIIQAARKVFVEKGFHGTTSKQLAEAAGVSEALLFKHFPSKEALYRAILTSCCRRKDAKEAEQVSPFESL